MYSGENIQDLRNDESKDACATRCCENPECDTWTWASAENINMCVLSSGDNLTFSPIKAHYSAKRTQGELSMPSKYIVYSHSKI